MPTTTRYAYNSPWDGRWRSGAAAFSYAEDDCVRRQGIPLPLSLAKKGSRAQKFAFYVEHCVPQGAKFLIYKENRRESQSKYISMAKDFKFGMKRKRKGEKNVPTADGTAFGLLVEEQRTRTTFLEEQRTRTTSGRIRLNPPTPAGLGGTSTTFATVQTDFTANVWANINTVSTRPPDTVPVPPAEPELDWLTLRSALNEPEREE